MINLETTEAISIMSLLDNDEVITMERSFSHALAEYMYDNGIDLDDYRYDKVEGGVEVWKA